MLLHNFLNYLGIDLAIHDLGLVAEHNLHDRLLFAQADAAGLGHGHTADLFGLDIVKDTLHRVACPGGDPAGAHCNDNLDVAGCGFQLFFLERFLTNAL